MNATTAREHAALSEVSPEMAVATREQICLDSGMRCTSRLGASKWQRAAKTALARGDPHDLALRRFFFPYY
jgi:hypothetical protein